MVESGGRGTQMFFGGVYQHKMDAKKRLFIPAKYRSALSDGFVVCKAPDRCLYIYAKEDWEPVAKQMLDQPGSKEFRRLKREFFKNTDVVEMDSQGRFTVKKELLDLAGLKQDCILIGAGNKIEVWDAEYYMQDLEETKTADDLDVEIKY